MDAHKFTHIIKGNAQKYSAPPPLKPTRLNERHAFSSYAPSFNARMDATRFYRLINQGRQDSCFLLYNRKQSHFTFFFIIYLLI